MTFWIKLIGGLLIVGAIWGAAWGVWRSVNHWCNVVCQDATKLYVDLRKKNAADDAAALKAKAIQEAQNEADHRAAEQAAQKTAADLAAAQKSAADAKRERDAALARMGGVVRDLAAARGLLGASSTPGGGQTTANPPAVVRDNPGDSGANLAGRLAACQSDLTVLTDTLSINMENHTLALLARNACVKQYNDVRTIYNGSPD